MTKDAFEARRNSFEEEYARKNDAQLVDKLRELFHRNIDREALRQATGITDEQVLDNLASLHVGGELLAAFQLYPLIEVAWASGEVDERERRAVLAAVDQHGIPRDSRAYAMLDTALKDGLRPDARKVWYRYAEELRNVLSAQELTKFRDDLLAHARNVAEASGGILNAVLTVSPEENKVLKAIHRALTPEGT